MIKLCRDIWWEGKFMIKRVFVYSEEIATQNGNQVSFNSLKISLLTTLISGILLFILLFIYNYLMVLISLIVFLGSIISIFVSVVKLVFSLKNSIVAYAIDTNDRVFQIVASNDSDAYLSGAVTVSYMSQFNILSLIFVVFAYKKVYNIFKEKSNYISNPEVVEKMVENSRIGNEADVFEFLKVYSIKETKKSFIVYCDYKFLKNDIVNRKRKVVIEKSYRFYEDLINALKLYM